MINRKIKYLNNTISEDTIKEYSRIYDLHKYWSRKPWHPIAECIQKYSKEGDIVLDMFLGSGVTALESISVGRDFVGFDLNPMSIFISENTISNDFNVSSFLKELDAIKLKLLPIIDKLYTVSDVCGFCHENLTIQHINLGPAFKGKETIYVFCGKCGKRTKLIRKATKEELAKSFKKYKLNKWVPKNSFPKKFYKDRFSYKGIKKVTDMYTPKNLYFLSELLHAIKTTKLRYRNLFLVAFTNTVLHASKLKGENVRPLNVNNYWIPDDYFEENPWLRFLERIELIVKSKRCLEKKIGNNHVGECKLHNKSCFSTRLDDEKVDYIITDPPYGDAVQYSELSYIWNSWMGYKYETDEEVIINPVQNKSVDVFLKLLEKSIIEANRVLKPGKRYTLCFHNKEFKIWKGVLDIFKKYDFLLENTEIVDTNGNSYNKNWAEFSPKTDLYLTFIKSKYTPTHLREFSIQEVLSNILTSYNISDPSMVYDELAVTLINELYFNEYQIDISHLTIKKIGEMMGMMKNGN
ncbi:MAG: DNA methyltransferase [Elusimicrobiota bacterium]